MDWDEMARPWLAAAPDLETAFAEIFDALFAAARLKPGESVLDVGCGTGPTLAPTAQAIGETGRILGIDVAPPMVAVAKERAPRNAELIVGDAGTYPFEPGMFDVIIANFGIMFFADSAAGFENLRRAVKAGGRMAATVWGLPADNPWFSMPRRVVDQRIADVPRPDPAGPGPMRFGDPSGLEAILKASGWAPNIRTIDLFLRPPGPAERVTDLHMHVTVGMMLKGLDVDPQTIEAIRSALTEANRAYQSDDGMAIPARIHVIEAYAA